MDSIEWQAPEYAPRRNSTDWYWAVGIIAASVAVISIVYNNPLFAILIIIATFTLSMFTFRHPLTISLEITPRGIRIDKTFYPYDSLESFWVEDDERNPKILFRSKKLLMPLILMPIEGIHPDDIRDYLLRFLPEHELAEPVTQKLMEYLGF